MSTVPNCNQANPIAAVLPNIPLIAGSPVNNPAQGDHVFGDALGGIRTALQDIFGGNQNWLIQMQAYDATLANNWTGLAGLDFGHGANPAIVLRQPAGAAGNETDQHSYMFGGYCQRLQWQMAEIACTGAHLTVGADANTLANWKKTVLARFDDLMGFLVDQTALNYRVTTGPGPRQAGGVAVVHPAISLAAAQTYVSQHPQAPACVTAPLKNFALLRNSFNGLLDRFRTGYYTLQPNGTWTQA